MLAQHPKVTGFRRAIVEAGVQSIECWQAFAPDQTTQGYQYENGFRATQTLLRSGQPFTALVARNDFLALGALRALREAGRRVPEDVSVIGYTDSIHALCSDPALTSVRTAIVTRHRRGRILLRGNHSPDLPHSTGVVRSNVGDALQDREPFERRGSMRSRTTAEG
jgi:DNA-binding LacI/PurR family transcriptional regulator